MEVRSAEAVGVAALARGWRSTRVICGGGGFGGGTVALTLARAGLRVLVVERGRWVDRDDSAWDPVAIQIEQKYRSESPEDQDGRDGRTMPGEYTNVIPNRMLSRSMDCSRPAQ